MTPILYEEVIIFIHPIYRLRRIVEAFHYGARHIRSVVLYDTSNGVVIPKVAEALIGHGLARCPHIHNLEIHGAQSCVFTHRRWLQKTAPQLSSTTTSLSITGTSNDLSNSLVGIGRNLQSLEIKNWQPGPWFKLTPTFHLPTEMPNLTDLTIRGPCYVDMGRVRKLFERIRVKHDLDIKRIDVPLRSLVFINVAIGTQDIMALLQINSLCCRLTSLHISSSLHIRHGPEFPVYLVEACPMLVDFRYLAPANKEIFQHLRPNLQHLGLLLPTQSPPTQPFIEMPSVDDFTKYLKSERARSLQTLYIVKVMALDSWRTSTLFDDTSLKSVCEEVRISLLYPPSIDKQGNVIWY
jgi:hypothetical protein